jgi:uncharacterized protein (UPF0212 family)
MGNIKCDVCEKDLVSNIDGVDKAYVALTLKFGIVDENEREFVQRMLGVYEIDKSYHICPECWLKTLGIKNNKFGVKNGN